MRGQRLERDGHEAAGMNSQAHDRERFSLVA